jgi:HEPN domain-containing protein
MPPRRDPADPREWLNRAASSLAHARSSVEGVYLEDLCFDAQQAAEKAIKPVLVFRRVRFPYVHDVEVLLTALSEAGEDIPESIWQARKLNPYAVEARYPSIGRQVTPAQYADALRIAEAVLRWAEHLIP